MRVKVNPKTQVYFDGRLYTGGKEFDAPSEQAEKWVAAGWATEVKTKRRAAARSKGRR
jgi:hypothetical protein